MVTLTKSSSIVPDAGTYELEFVRHSEIVKMTDFDDDSKLVNKIYLTFAVVNFDFDDEVDTQDWNGVEFPWLAKVSLHKRSNLGPVVAALAGLTDVDDLPGAVELGSLIGKRITATVGKTPSGYAKLSGAMPVRKKKKAAAPVANVFTADDDDE